MKQRRTAQPRSLAAALGKVTAKAYKKRGFAAPSVVNEWPAIVGPALARGTLPERLGRDGTLRVRVAGPVATELQHMEPQILERIAQYFGYRAVRRLAFVRAPLAAPRAAPPPPPALSPVPAEALAAAERGTRDARLREALTSLGRAVLAKRRVTP